MKNLVIHISNVPDEIIQEYYSSDQHHLINLKAPKTQITRPDWSYDRYYHEQLSKEINDVYERIYITINLSEDYLEMNGLRVAHQIRLTNSLNNTRTPIVIISQESLYEIIANTNLGMIFLTPKTYLSKDLLLQEEFNFKPLSENEYADYVNNTNITPPAFFDSHHSVANEYALYNWSKQIEIDEKIEIVNNNLKYRLYFKWLDASRLLTEKRGWPPDEKNVQQDQQDKKRINHTDAKILLIDDESEKGWGQFYRGLLGKRSDMSDTDVDTHFTTLESGDEDRSLGDLKGDEIVKKAKEIVKEVDPDVVLLDLRLSKDEDFRDGIAPEKLTGIRIAEAIYEENKGIQVIITSASNKIPNYLAAEKKGLGVDGYIIKSMDDDPKVKIEEIIETLNTVIPKAKFLKNASKKISEIERLSKLFNARFFEAQKSNLERAYQLAYRNDLNFSYLMLFQFLESFTQEEGILEEQGNDYYVVSKNGLRIRVLHMMQNAYMVNYVYDSETKHHLFNDFFLDDMHTSADRYKKFARGIPKRNFYMPIGIIMPLILTSRYKDFEIQNENFNTIRVIRNTKTGHGYKTNKYVTEEEYRKILNFLVFIMDESNISDENRKMELKYSTISEDIKKGEQSRGTIPDSYNQKIIVEYSSKPSDAKLRVEVIPKNTKRIILIQDVPANQNQSEIILKDLPSNGGEVHVFVGFCDEMDGVKKTDFFCAPKSETKKKADQGNKKRNKPNTGKTKKEGAINKQSSHSCSIKRIEKGEQRVNKEAQTYTQEIVVYYSYASKQDKIVVNNQEFEVSPEAGPLILILKGLPSDGKQVDVIAKFKGEQKYCEKSLFTAPISEDEKKRRREKIKAAKRTSK